MICVCVCELGGWGGAGRGVRSFKSWLFRGPRVKTERPIPPLSSRSRLNVPFFFFPRAVRFLFFYFFFFKACCVSGRTQSVDREEPVLWLRARFFFFFFIAFGFFCVLANRKKKKKKHRESIAPVRERERKRVGGVLVLCQSWGLSLSLCLFVSLSPVVFFFRSLPLTAIHRLHRPKLLDLSPLTTM